MVIKAVREEDPEVERYRYRSEVYRKCLERVRDDIKAGKDTDIEDVEIVLGFFPGGEQDEGPRV